MKYYLSKAAIKLDLGISVFIFGTGIALTLFEGIFVGIWFLVLGLIGIIYLIIKLKNNQIIVEVCSDKLRVPIQNVTIEVFWEDIIKAQRVIEPILTDNPDSYILLFLKSCKTPLKIVLPELTISESDLVKIINNMSRSN